MTIVETVLVFVGIPAGIIAVLAFGVYGKTLLHQPNRYRPGKAWTYAPSWFVAHPEALHQPTAPATSVTAVGGASGEW
jgi:hypothetical protein